MSLHLKKMRKFLIPVIAALLALSLILIYTRPEPYRPLHPVDPAKAPIFSDDFNLESLIHVTRTQIKYLEKIGSAQVVTAGIAKGTPTVVNFTIPNTAVEILNGK